MFTDDDDLLHPGRCAAYKAAIVASEPKFHAVSAGWVARPVHREDSVTSAADVEALVSNGRIVRTPKEGSEKQGGGGSWDEFWNSAMRLSVFEAFLATSLPPPARTCKYADIALFYYLRNSIPTLRFLPHRLGFSAHWMHYYDKPLHLKEASRVDVQGASAGVSVQATDLERVEKALEVLRASAAKFEAGLRLKVAQSQDTAMRDASLELDQCLADHDAAVRDFKRSSGNGQSITYRSADGEERETPATPMLMLVARMRSILELFCAPFVGAPNLPSDATLLEMSRVVVVDALICLGAPPRVSAILGMLVLEPMLRENMALFGLPGGRSLGTDVRQIA